MMSAGVPCCSARGVDGVDAIYECLEAKSVFINSGPPVVNPFTLK